MTVTTILIIDDDTELCALLKEYLGDEGFELETCHDVARGRIRLARRFLHGGYSRR